MKSDKLFNATYTLLIGICLTIFGIITLIGKKWLYINIINILLLFIFIRSLKHILNYFVGRKKDKKINFTRSIISLVSCFILIFFKNIPLSIFPLLVGLYFLLNALIKFINVFIYIKTNSNGKISEFFFGLVYLFLSLPIVFAPLENIDSVLLLFGVYILLLGISYIIDFILIIVSSDIRTKVRKKIRIHLPAIIEALIPHTILNEINYLLDKEAYDKPFIFEEKDNDDADIDIEIFVHVSDRNFNKMGHVDLCIGNKIICYGGYDDSSQHFFNSIGDGVLYTTTRSKYINFCIEHSKKTLFAYGIKLTNRQKEYLDKTLTNLFDKELYKWEPPYQKDIKNNPDINEYKDYASWLYYKTKAKFYKFYSGRYKSFFVLGNNCCRMVDYILEKSKVDIMKINGVITPGAYYEYLNREFHRKNSPVISRKIYNEKNKTNSNVPKFKGFSK